MAVCFFVEGSPIKEVPAFGYDDEPLLDEAGNPVMFHEYALPYFEVCSGNFKIFMQALSLPVGEDQCGEFSIAELPAIRRRIIAALNSADRRLRPAQHLETFFDAGMDRKRLDSYLNSLLSVVLSAQEHNSSVRYC